MSPSLSDLWKKFAAEQNLVPKIKLPRHIPYSDNCGVQLLDFLDASEKGYVAVIYLKIQQPNDSISNHFITVKSKLAHLKTGNSNTTTTIPRLELCGALLLAHTKH